MQQQRVAVIDALGLLSPLYTGTSAGGSEGESSKRGTHFMGGNLSSQIILRLLKLPDKSGHEILSIKKCIRNIYASLAKEKDHAQRASNINGFLIITIH